MYTRVAMVGTYEGQEIVTVFWYLSETDGWSLVDYTAVINALDAEFIENLWLGADVTPDNDGEWLLAHLLPIGYQWEKNVYQSYSSDGFLPVTGMPVERPKSGHGLGVGSTLGPTSVIWARASLNPGFGPGIGLPRKGGWFLGPLMESAVDDSGHLTDVWQTRWQGLASRFAQFIITEFPTQTFIPLKVRMNYSPSDEDTDGVLVDISYRTLDGVVVSPLQRSLKSRRPEA